MLFSAKLSIDTSALDLDAPAGEAFLEHALGLALGDHQGVGIARVDAVHGDARHDVLAVRELRAMSDVAGLEERLDVAAMFEKFQRARPQHQRLGFVGPRRGLVDDPHGMP